MHKNVSGKITRSTESWKINEDMIYSKKAFIIQVIYNQKQFHILFFFIILKNVFIFPLSH